MATGDVHVASPDSSGGSSDAAVVGRMEVGGLGGLGPMEEEVDVENTVDGDPKNRGSTANKDAGPGKAAPQQDAGKAKPEIIEDEEESRFSFAFIGEKLVTFAITFNCWLLISAAMILSCYLVLYWCVDPATIQDSIGLISWAVFLAFIAGGVKRRGDLVARFNRQRMQKTQYVQVTLYDPALRIIGGWGAVVAWYCLAMVPFVDRVIFKNQNWMFPTGYISMYPAICIASGGTIIASATSSQLAGRLVLVSYAEKNRALVSHAVPLVLAAAMSGHSLGMFAAAAVLSLLCLTTFRIGTTISSFAAFFWLVVHLCSAGFRSPSDWYWNLTSLPLCISTGAAVLAYSVEMGRV